MASRGRSNGTGQCAGPSLPFRHGPVTKESRAREGTELLRRIETVETDGAYSRAQEDRIESKWLGEGEFTALLQIRREFVTAIGIFYPQHRKGDAPTIHSTHEVQMRSAVKLAGLLGILGSFAGAEIAVAQGSPPPTPSVTVGGVVYAQYLYQLKDTANHVNNFDITRSYINVIGKFPTGLLTRVTADIYRNTDGSLAYRLKYAYAGYTPEGSALTFKLGQIHTPWLDWEEALWDYRMQGQMALERAGYISSSDFGLGVDGNWAKDKVNMQVGIYNGENYNKAPGDKRKDAMGRVSVRVLDTDDGSRVGGLRLTGYSQLGKPTGGGLRDRFAGMASYRSKQLTLAGEYARTKDRLDTSADPAVPPTGITVDGQVLSFFGVFKVPQSKAAIIGRVDLTDPNTDVDGNRQTRYIAGVSYQLTPALRLLADVDNLGFQGDPTPAQYATKTQGLFQAQYVF